MYRDTCANSNRWLVGLASAVSIALGVASPVSAADSEESAGGDATTLTVREAVQRALKRTSFEKLHEAEADAAEAAIEASGNWPNPGFSYDLEQPNDPTEPNIERESFFLLEQEFPISGRLGLEADAARREAEATEFEIRARRLDVAAEVESRFYELLHLQKTLEAREAWIERLESSKTIVEKQMEAGETSKFDVLEMEREIGAARADTRSLRATFERRRREFAALVGVDERTPLQLDGAITFDGELPPKSEISKRLAERPELRALRSQARAAEATSSAAGRAWVPEPALRGGYKLTNLPREENDKFGGFMLGLSITLPVWNFGQSASRQASAEARQYRSRAALIKRRATARAHGLYRETDKLQKTAEQFREETLGVTKKLVETAKAAYKKGNTGILELVDAHSSLLEDRLKALDLDLEAALKRVELERSLGLVLRQDE